jgi:predicted nucleotidyltransferase
MKVAGIIAEYNPMHEGHKYLFSKLRNEFGIDKIIVAMSGSYAQRGIPVCLDKYLRAEAALFAGADIVLELPASVSLGSAELFATGAVKLLDSTGVVNYLAFGSESGNTGKLSEAATLLLNEDKDFKSNLSTLLSSGFSYPLAIEKALEAADSELSVLLKSPNNTLAIEYIKALQRTGSKIIPLTIKRNGADFNSISFDALRDIHPSATYLRECLKNENRNEFWSDISADMKKVLNKFGFTSSTVPFITANDFTLPLISKLAVSDFNELLSIADCNKDFLNRLLKCYSGASFEELTDKMHTKQLTRSRVQRALFHILLDIRDSDMDHIKNDKPDYIHVLGIRKESSGLLKEIVKASEVPVICRYRDYEKADESVKMEFNKDLKAYELYRQIFLNKYSRGGYRISKDLRGIIVV